MRSVNRFIALLAVAAALVAAWIQSAGSNDAATGALDTASPESTAALALIAIIAAANFLAMLSTIVIHHSRPLRAGARARPIRMQPLRGELIWASVPVVILFAAAIAATGWMAGN